MLNEPLLRAGVYLFCFLLGMITGGYFPEPYRNAVTLCVVLLVLLIEWKCYASGKVPVSFAIQKKSFSVLLFFPIFFAITLGMNLLSAKLFPVSHAAASPVIPSPALFLGAVLLAPLAEEIFFRGILLRLFSKYGDVWGVFLSASAFALAHGNFFQMPYAFTAGLLLAVTALFGGSILYPILFHLLYNLCTFFSGYLSPVPLLLSAGATAIAALISLAILRPAWRFTRGKRPALKNFWLLFLYAGETIYIAVTRIL